MEGVTAFDFESLPKVTREEADLLQALQAYLPRLGVADKLASLLKGLISKELGLRFSFRMDRVTTISLEEKLPSLPRQGIYALIGMEPVEGKAFLELDPLLSHMMIDKLMGGTGEPLTMIRPLTEIESGVLSYLFLKAFAEIFSRFGATARVHFRLEGLVTSREEILPSLGGARDAVLITYRLQLGNRAGYARFFLPAPFLQQVMLDPMEDPEGADDQERQYFLARLQNLGFVPANYWAEIGRSTLKAGSIQKLEPGDVVVLQDTEARVERGQLGGALRLRVGRGEHGAFLTEVLDGDGPIRLKVTAQVQEGVL